MLQSKLNVVGKIAKYMGVSKKSLIDKVEGQGDLEPILRFPEIPTLSPYLFVCTALITPGVEMFLDFSKFIRSPVYEEWEKGLGHSGVTNQDRLIVAWRCKHNQMVLYRATNYTGVGGLFVRDEDYCGKGWCCEPIANWLVNRVPKFMPD